VIGNADRVAKIATAEIIRCGGRAEGLVVAVPEVPFPLWHQRPYAKAVGEALTSKAAEHSLASRPLCQLDIAM